MTKFRIVALGTGVALAAGIAVAIAGTPFGGDDTGTIPDPSHKTTLKCEDGIGKAVGCIGKCTLSRSSGKFTDDATEDACEKNNAGKSCLEKFQASVAKLTGCPSCINAASLSKHDRDDARRRELPDILCVTQRGIPRVVV